MATALTKSKLLKFTSNFHIFKFLTKEELFAELKSINDDGLVASLSPKALITSYIFIYGKEFLNVNASLIDFNSL